MISSSAISWLTLFNILIRVTSLKDLRVEIPEIVVAGDTVTLSCFFTLEDESLYSVRWYYEQEEFYRFMPLEYPPIRVFATAGLQIDTSKSSQHNVTILSVARKQSGSYLCEASADAPTFHTVNQHGTMTVAELPQYGPIITTYGMPEADTKNHVQIGETFKASCTSGPSFPTVNFTWEINGNKYPSTHSGLRNVDNLNDTSPKGNEEKEAWSEIVIHVDNHILNPLYNYRKLVIRCEINVHDLFRKDATKEFDVLNIEDLTNDGKVSPTTIDQRGHRGDPDNSALRGNAISSGMTLRICKLLMTVIFLATV